MASSPAPPTRRRPRRWLFVAVGVGALFAILLALVASLPFLIGTQYARTQILAQINQTLAPGRLDVDRFEVSWTSPTRLVRFKLIAPDGNTVADARVAEISRSLGQILLRRPGSTVLNLERTRLAIHRSADGKLDLVEALKTVIDQPDPDRDLTIRIKGGSLDFRADGLADPFIAQAADLDLQIPPSPLGLTWTLKLKHSEGGELVAKGDTNRWTARDKNPSLADFRLDLEAKRWPIANRAEGLTTRGFLEGSAGAVRRGERWELEGNVRLLDLNFAGERLSGDTLRPGPVSVAWSLGQAGDGWAIRRMSVDSAIGSGRLEGRFDSKIGFVSTTGEPGRVEAQVDLAAVAQQLPNLLGLKPGLMVEGGSARLTAQPIGKDSSAWSFEANVADVSAKDGDRRLDFRDPVSMSAEVARAGDSLTVKAMSAHIPFLSASGSGRVDDLNSLRRFDFQGEIKPDFEAINTWLVRQVEPGAKLAGQPRPFRVGGVLSGSDPIGSVEGEVGFDLASVDLYGIKLGPAPIVVRARGGQILVDPISTTLNEGQIRLEPEIVLQDTKGEPTLRLGKNSTIRDANINDDVSRRVLSFVAPVLEGATRVSGRLSVDLDHAEFSLKSGRSRSAVVEGLVVFNDVAFAPGPLANDLLGAIGRRDASVKLDRPVTLTIADGRVNQSGLAIPVGDLTRIELAGWVDFDRNLALTATLPVTAAMLGNNPLLSDIAAGTQVRLPIGGTLSKPKIDREAFTASLKDLGKSLLTRGATRGALELLLRATRPKDPNAAPDPPPLTAEERKALRLERKAERKARRDSPNP